MKALYRQLSLLLIAAWCSCALNVRAEDTAGDITSFRPMLEQRIWTFSYQNKPIGHLVSWVKEKQTVDGRTVLVLQEKLDVDYTATGAERRIFVEGQHLVTPDGRYDGDRKEIKINDQQERFEWTRHGDSVTGFFTRGGQKVARSLALRGIEYAWDAGFFDQLELLLARHELAVGKTIQDSVLVPRDLLINIVQGSVIDFQWKELWKNRFDSVYVVHLTRPQEYMCYFAPDKRLVRTDIVGQGIRVYQDAIILPKKGVTKATTKVTPPPPARLPWWAKLVALLPHLIAHLIVAAIAILLVAWQGFKMRKAYASFGVGVVAFGILAVTAYPLHQAVVAKIVAPGVQAGKSLYLLGILPALVLGLFIEPATLIATAVINRLGGNTRYRAVWGAFVGAGLGVIEAVYLSYGFIVPLMSWQFFERAFVAVFHVAAGCLLGWSLGQGRGRVFSMLVAMTALDSLYRYLPVLIQESGWRTEPLQLMFALLSLFSLAAAILLLRRSYGGEPNPVRL